jgi:hypothetical protein
VRRRSWKLGLFLIVAAIALGACTPGKSYRFPSVRIDATVNPDGSLTLVEQRTYDFRGHFHFATFTVEHKQFDDVVDFHVREGTADYVPDGVETAGHASYDDPVLEGPGGFKFKATWWFDAANQNRTFTISYRVLCAVDVYSDTAHLLWKFIGEGWTVPTDSALITVHLPGASIARPQRPAGSCFAAEGDSPAAAPPEARPLVAGEVRAWGHGPLQGNVRIPDPQTVVLDVQDVVPGAFVEGSVLFPATVVPFAAASSEPKLASILAEEQSLANQANQARADARVRAHRRDITRLLLKLWAIGLVLFAAIVIAIARSADRVPDVPPELDAPPEPDLHPAKLAMRWAWVHRRSGVSNAFRAELLHLARIRSVDVVPTGTVTESKDYLLTLKAVPTDQIDERFANFLFTDDQPVDLDKLRPTEDQRAELRKWRHDLQEDVDKAFPGGGGRPETRMLGVTLDLSATAGVVLGVVFRAGWMLTALLPMEAMVLWIVARRLILRWVQGPERQAMARWEAFRRHLKHFSGLRDAPAAAVVIWEQYLAFATALGVADRVRKQVRAIVPTEDLPAPWPGAPSGLFGLQALSSVSSVSAASPVGWLSTISSSIGSSSSWSSGGGGGGGFSGGGGGGGGGTGGSAG